ncbi:hypothetical protein AVEN_168974-1 [Araneus ventricosus]|uniref:Uncharacterized protein n=1 Tax=Araneus ventricosus TaxID=182803 RepID=A0A4Y2JL86_ARAVE|nr:hypothetical protein AVEN_168974-1 [Araneus ventricosus]
MHYPSPQRSHAVAISRSAQCIAIIRRSRTLPVIRRSHLHWQSPTALLRAIIRLLAYVPVSHRRSHACPSCSAHVRYLSYRHSLPNHTALTYVAIIQRSRIRCHHTALSCDCHRHGARSVPLSRPDSRCTIVRLKPVPAVALYVVGS